MVLWVRLGIMTTAGTLDLNYAFSFSHHDQLVHVSVTFQIEFSEREVM